MKIFAIRDESAPRPIDLAYLLYYEVEKCFFIELPENADPWETPLLLSSFAKRGEPSINSYWSKLWVQQRIIPIDRQNLGQILKDNNLKEYDEFGLLMLAIISISRLTDKNTILFTDIPQIIGLIGFGRGRSLTLLHLFQTKSRLSATPLPIIIGAVKPLDSSMGI